MHTCLAFSQPVVFCDNTHSAAEDYLVFAPLNSTLPRMFVRWGKWHATHRLAVFLFVSLQTRSSFTSRRRGVRLAKRFASLQGNLACRKPLAKTFAAQWRPVVRIQPALRAKIISLCRNRERQAWYNVWLCRQSLPHCQKQCLCVFKSALRSCPF